MDYIFVGIVVGVIVLALVFGGLFLTVFKQWAQPGEPEHKISYLHVALLGVGGSIGFGSLIAALVSLTNAQTLETQRAEAESVLETQRAESELLREYLQSMQTLATDNKLPEFEDIDDSEKERIKRAARAQTLAVLEALEDSERKGIVVRFLDESELIKKPEPIVDLSGVDIVGADLAYVGLGDADLSQAVLIKVNLIDASLIGTYLYGAHLDGADLRGANFTEANLGWTGLAGADLRGADLTNADLRDAVGITSEELEQQAKSLKGATMPDGSVHD